MSDSDTQRPQDLDAWRRRVEAELAGSPFDKLRTRLVEGLVVEPLYASLAASSQRAHDALGVSATVLAAAPDEGPEADPLLGAAPSRDLARHLAGETIAIDLRGIDLAGAHALDELAAALLAVAQWLEVASDAGHEPRAVAAKLVVRVAAGPDLLWQIAKLRALRLLVRRLLELVAPGGPAAEPQLHAFASTRAFTAHDPWTNLLRNTASVFAAIVGGADRVTPLPFDAPLSVQSADAARLAENTVRLALDEAHLAKVQDPAAGAFALEAWTDALCAAAWERFQGYHAQGGLTGAGADALAASIGQTHGVREARVRKRQDGLIGTSLYPNLDEVLPSVPAHDAASAARDAAPFDRLRAAAATLARTPRVLLVNLGPVAEHLARATWVKGLVEAGGLRAIDHAAPTDLTTLGAALTAHDAHLAIICAADVHFGTQVAAVASALTNAGAHALVAGRPGAHEAALREAGARGFVHVGLDVVDLLTDLLRREGAAL
jgi:methylmalonyl-CoA mutase